MNDARREGRAGLWDRAGPRRDDDGEPELEGI
jgi:hypothetical protein